MNIIVAGDYCENNRSSEYIKSHKYEELFGEIKPIIEKSDIAIANFEFPIISENSLPIAKTGPHLGGSLESIGAIQYAGFNVLTLANNHILDQGAKSCIDTKHLLENAGFKTVGVGENLKDANKVLYLTQDNKKIAIINCCEHEFTIASESSAGANPLNPISIYNSIQEAKEKSDFVLVIVHGGIEHFQYPTLRMKETYRFFISVGADAVINHHQHCYSGYEIYEGKPIFYGLGNFHFDFKNKKDCIWNYGYLVSLDTDDPLNFKIIPYKQCNDSVSTRPLYENEAADFFTSIKEINYAIQDNTLLNTKKNEFVTNTSLEFKYILSPYSLKRLNSLYFRGILPDLRDQSRWLKLLNAIQCESHRERILDYIKSRIKG